MPRPKGERESGFDELDLLIAELTGPSEPDWRRDPGLALERLRAGGLSAAERDEVRARAEEALAAAVEMVASLDSGATRMGPRELVARVRGEPARWRRVLGSVA